MVLKIHTSGLPVVSPTWISGRSVRGRTEYRDHQTLGTGSRHQTSGNVGFGHWVSGTAESGHWAPWTCTMHHASWAWAVSFQQRDTRIGYWVLPHQEPGCGEQALGRGDSMHWVIGTAVTVIRLWGTWHLASDTGSQVLGTRHQSFRTGHLALGYSIRFQALPSLTACACHIELRVGQSPTRSS